MSYSRLIIRDGADIVWGLDDLNTETASISTPITFLDNSASYYSASINASATNLVGTPIIFGGRTALELTSSANACISIPALNLFSEIYSRNNYALEFWLKIDKVPDQEITIVKKRNSNNTGLYLRDNYLIYRYGNSSSYVETSYGLAELDEPNHIVMNYNKDTIQLLVNGISSIKNIGDFDTTEIDTNHSINNYIDFYGISDCSIIVDSIAIYPNTISSNKAKRHYVYGLGKSISESVFSDMGGVFFNLGNNNTRKSFFEYWDSYNEWFELNYDNLELKQNGIGPILYIEPTLGSLDNKITKTQNRIRFSSTSSTVGSYIDLTNFSSIFNEKNNTFFAKFRLDGTPPVSGSYQTLISLGQSPFNEILNFNLINIAGSYYIQAYHVESASTVSFSIPSITSSPTIYVGAMYNGETKIYFSASSASLQSASFTTYSGSVYGVDLLSTYFPLESNSILRIGSRYNFDTIFTASTKTNQFLGSFESLMFVDNKFTASTYSAIDSYNQYIYKTYFDTNDNRFKVGTFGTASFIFAGARLGDIDFSGSAFISSNRFEFGYPNAISGSQVQIFISMYDYSGNVIKSREKVQKVNFFEWLNLTNINDKYLKFDIEMLSKDTSYYPPILKYFKAEAYPDSGSYTDILGYMRSYVRVRNGASAQAYIPEFIQTPTVLLTENSGVRSNKNYIDILFGKGNIGTLGFFIRPNTNSTSTKVFEVFSSSAATTSLFTASIRSNLIITSSAIGTSFINGGRSSSVSNLNWNHFSFTFNPKLGTSSVDSFLIRFGDTTNSNFNIQNIYILDTLLEPAEISYIDNGFVGGSAVISATSAASAINVIDRDELRHTGYSASVRTDPNEKQATNIIFQPQLVQKRFLGDVSAATSLDSSSISNVLDYDGVDFTTLPDPTVSRILLLSNNKIYSISKSNDLNVGTEISSVDGDYVRVIGGMRNINKIFVKVNGVFTEYPELLKINAFETPKPPETS